MRGFVRREHNTFKKKKKVLKKPVCGNKVRNG